MKIAIDGSRVAGVQQILYVEQSGETPHSWQPKKVVLTFDGKMISVWADELKRAIVALT